jgi:hypothetical protein
LIERTIKAVTIGPGSVSVLFDDQSNMKIKTAGAMAVSVGSKVKSVHEAKADFKIEFEEVSSATFCLAGPGLFRCRAKTRIMQWNTSDRSDDKSLSERTVLALFWNQSNICCRYKNDLRSSPMLHLQRVAKSTVPKLAIGVQSVQLATFQPFIQNRKEPIQDLCSQPHSCD